VNTCTKPKKSAHLLHLNSLSRSQVGSFALSGEQPDGLRVRQCLGFFSTWKPMGLFVRHESMVPLDGHNRAEIRFFSFHLAAIFLKLKISGGWITYAYLN
jgi:hypothetical protein